MVFGRIEMMLKELTTVPDAKAAIEMALLINISTKMAIDDRINSNMYVCCLHPHAWNMLGPNVSSWFSQCIPVGTVLRDTGPPSGHVGNCSPPGNPQLWNPSRKSVPSEINGMMGVFVI